MRRQPTVEVIESPAPIVEVLLDTGAPTEPRRAPDERAYEQGFAAGAEQARAELASAVAAARAAAKEFTRRREMDTVGGTDGVVRLALGVAERILVREVSTHDLAAAAQRAMRRLTNATQVRVLLNPEDLGAVQSEDIDLSDNGRLADGVELVADASVGRGGCVVSAKGETVDARIESQIAKMWEMLTGETQ